MVTDNARAPMFLDAYNHYLLAQRSSNVVPRYILMLERTRDLFVQRLGNLQLDDIKPEDVRHWLIWLQGADKDTDIPAPRGKRSEKLSGAYVDIQFRNIKAFFAWCEEDELIYRSPMRKVKRPRFEELLPDALTEAEVVSLLDGIKSNGDRNAYRDFCITFFFLDTGVRMAELAHLDVDHVDLQSGSVRVLGKGRKARLVPMGIELRQALSRYLLKYRHAKAGENALFINEYGERLEARGVRSFIVRDLKHYIPRKLNHYGPHTLRHSCATFKLRYTRDIKMVSMILGHSTTRTTERYTHLTGVDVLRDAAGSAMDALIRNHGKN